MAKQQVDVGALIARMDRLEKEIQSIKRGDKEWIDSTSSMSIEDLKVEPVDANGNAFPQATSLELGVFALKDGRRVKVMVDGHCTNYNSGWPNYDHTCVYYGRFWSYNYDNGDPIIWSLLEVGVRDNCNITWEDRGGWFWKLQSSDAISFDTGRQSGHRKWSAWARFRLADGSGINITGIICNC